ncbi:MAG TPA: hypothetical protein VLB68_03705 [Pyrinomonadaceae bacterium]|nr:hypothetical protein [Pyrinomonadaceae bacterium]
MPELESTNDETIIAYLLGELPEDESERIERRYLEDESLFQRLEELEDELVDDYVGGALAPTRNAAFENHFLRTTERFEKVEFARAMAARASLWKKSRETEIDRPKKVVDIRTAELSKRDRSRTSPRWRELTAIAAALLFAVASAGLWFRVSSLQRQLETAKREQANLRQSEADSRKNTGELQVQLSEEQKQSQALEEKIKELEKLSSLDPANPVVYAVQLGIDYLISDSKGTGPPKVKTVTIPQQTSLLRLAVDFPKSDFQTFRVILRRHDRSTVWTRGGLKARPIRDNQNISLAIPADRITNGEYDLVLSGVNSSGDTESVAHYALKVERKD